MSGGDSGVPAVFSREMDCVDGESLSMILDVLENLTTASLRPPLKWAGGKRWLVPHLLPYWEKHSERRLIEPFCGGLAVTLGLIPTQALLNDRNPHLIHF